MGTYDGIEINGALLEAHVDAFRLFPSRALVFLAKNGIGSARSDGEIVVDFRRWYPMDAWLKAFDSILQSVGPSVVFDIGREVPNHAALPPDVKDVHGGIKAVDVGYHMNHRLYGEVMWNPRTGKMAEGIGHYGYAGKSGEKRIVSVCDNPYPCTFDNGILTTFARKFEANALVSHVDSEPCRARRGKSCTYAITW